MRVMICWLGIAGLFGLFVGCSTEGGNPSTASVEPAKPAAFNPAGAPIVGFNVPDMMCPEGCGEKTKEILAGQPGAKDVRIDFENKRAVVAVEESAFDANAALAALVDHGFDNSALEHKAQQPVAAEEAAVQ